MKKIIIAGGCLFAVLILLFASIPITAAVQTTTIKEKSIGYNFFVNLKNLLENKKSSMQPDGYPGELIGILINLIIAFFYWLSYIFPPS